MRRLAEFAEIAAAVLFLTPSHTSSITGTTFVVDGGWSALGYASEAT